MTDRPAETGVSLRKAGEDEPARPAASGVSLSKPRQATAPASAPPPAPAVFAPPPPTASAPPPPVAPQWQPDGPPPQPVVPPASSRPPAQPPGPQPPGRDRRIWYAAGGGLAAVIVIVIVVLVAFPGSGSQHADRNLARETSSISPQVSSQPTPGAATSTQATPEAAHPSASQVAAAIDGELATSVAARAGVQPALDAIAACQTNGTEPTVLRQAADVRRQLISQVSGLDVTELPGGAQLRQLLIGLWSDSAAADDAYVTWAEDQSSCIDQAANDDPAKTRGDNYSDLATAAKKRFLAQWNAVAARYGLAQRDYGHI